METKKYSNVETSGVQVLTAEDYKVSKSTARFIKIREDIQALYVSIEDAVEAYYGEEQMDRIMEEDFAPLLNKLASTSEEYVLSCIREKMIDIKDTKTI